MDIFDISGLSGGGQSGTNGGEPLAPVELLFGNNYVTLSVAGEAAGVIRALDAKILEQLIACTQRTVIANLAYLGRDNGADGSADSLTEAAAGELGRAFAAMAKAVRKAGKQILFVRAPEGIIANLRANLRAEPGMGECFFASLPAALRKVSASLLDSSSRELDLLKESVVEVFDKQFGLAVTSGEAKLVDDAYDASGGSIVGLIPLVSEGACGNMVIRFPRSALAALGRKAFGESFSDDDPELPQIAAELLNMVLGAAKEELNRRGYGIEQALPQTFVVNPGASMSFAISRPSWGIQFGTALGNFSLEISLKASGV